jgi:hypothetical protein
LDAGVQIKLLQYYGDKFLNHLVVWSFISDSIELSSSQLLLVSWMLRWV